MKKKLIKILLDRRRKSAVSGNLLEFDVTNTTIGTSTLSNVTGGDWSVVRNSEAWYKPTASTLTKVGIHIARIESGKILIEGAGTNLLGYSDEFNVLGWALTGLSVSTHGSITAPDGTLTSQQVTEISSARMNADPAVGVSNGFKSIWARTVSGTGVLSSLSGGLPDQSYAITETWQELSLDSDNCTYPDRYYAVDFRYATDVTDVLLWGPKDTSEATNTSYIESTGGVAGTRAADVITIAVPAGASSAETWIDGVSDGGQSVTPAATFTMLNETTKIIMT